MDATMNLFQDAHSYILRQRFVLSNSSTIIG